MTCTFALCSLRCSEVLLQLWFAVSPLLHVMKLHGSYKKKCRLQTLPSNIADTKPDPAKISGNW